MKSISVRFLLLIALVGAYIFGPFNSSIGIQAWTTFVATVFAFTVIRCTGWAPIFISIAIVFATAIVPFVILCAAGLHSHGSWSASASHVAYDLNHSNTFHGFDLLVPSAISIALMAFFGRRVGPGNSLERIARK